MTIPFFRALAPLRCFLLAVPAGLFAITGLAEGTPSSETTLDWVPREALSPEQQQAIPTGCCGAYVDPLGESAAAGPGLSGKREPSHAQDTIHLSGDESQLTRDSTIMTGHVELLQGSRQLTGDQAEIFNEPRSVQLEGNVTYREPGFLLEGDKAAFHLEQDVFHIERARYVLHENHIHGSASRIERQEDGRVSLDNSTYTYCEPADPLWQLHSHSMTLDTEAQEGSATHVWLEVASIPVFYFPYLRFPLGKERQSGFLMPSLIVGEDGLDISIPYYFNLAPNYDLTLMPRHIADRGSQLGAEFRHLHQFFDSTVSAAWLPDDKQAERDRWVLGLQQRGGARQPWSTKVNYTRVSDPDYFEDLNSAGMDIAQQTHLRQSAAAGYMTEHWETDVEVETFQTLRDKNSLKDPYKKLPSFSADGSYFLAPGLQLELDQQIARFDSDNSAQITGNRLAADYRLAWRSPTEGVYIETSAMAHYRGQQLDRAPGDDSPEVLAPGFAVDSGLLLDRSSANYHHTLAPRLYYSYTDYENQDDFQLFDTDEVSFDYTQLYESRRLSGDDLIGDSDQTSIGIEYRLTPQNQAEEWMRFGIGQTFYHRDRRVTGFDPLTFTGLPAEYRQRYTRDRSPLAAMWQWDITPHWQLDSQLAWEETSQDTESSQVFLHYNGDDRSLFSIGYRHNRLLTQLDSTTYLMETIRQGHLSGYWPINDLWALTGAVRYDFTHQRGLENIIGFQYEDCCWRLRTLYRQWKSNPDEVLDISQHEQEQGIYFEIQFKGLASTGKQIESLLNDNVHGYVSD